MSARPVSAARPIVMSAWAVRAILGGHMTQTRRVLTREDARGARFGWEGDRLWVQEPWCVSAAHNRTGPANLPHEDGLTVLYRAGGSMARDDAKRWVRDDTWPAPGWQNLPEWAGQPRRPDLMPRWASRIELELIHVRTERLHSITGAAAKASGLLQVQGGGHTRWQGMPDTGPVADPVEAFRQAFEAEHGKRVWARNPQVLALTFREIRA